MGVRKEVYIIHGLKFDENFTDGFFKKKFSDEMQWNKNKLPEDPWFITDGMNGDYTFFGFIKCISNGWDDEDYEIIEIKSFNSDDADKIYNKFKEFYPDYPIPEPKTYYLPHYT